MLKLLASLIARHEPHLKLQLLEIGARPVAGYEEPFYKLLKIFPGSRIIGFEVEKALCEQMNAQAPEGVHYYPVALGERDERRPFYVTENPVCSSLYEPNQELIQLYHRFEGALVKQTIDIDTVRLDSFAQAHQIGSVDFIKIDVQGAELDIFKGAPAVLQDTLMIVGEVEFIPHYVNQPLFGDVCAHLAKKGLMFHKFIGLTGRSLKPVVLNKSTHSASQHIWSDAVFIHHIQQLDQLSLQQMLKLAVLSCVYGSPDLTYHCLSSYDQRQSSRLASDFMNGLATISRP